MPFKIRITCTDCGEEHEMRSDAVRAIQTRSISALADELTCPCEAEFLKRYGLEEYPIPFEAVFDSPPKTEVVKNG